MTGSAVAGADRSLLLPRRAAGHARGRAGAQPQRARVRAHRRDARPHADAHRARRLLRALVGALLATSTPSRSSRRFPPPGRRSCRGRARTPACSGCRTAGRSPSRSSRTTTRRRSSRTRARPPASAASCATCSPWARARSRCSTASGSARSTSPRNRYLFAGVVRGVGDYGNCVGVPDARRRGRLRRRATPATRWSTRCASACCARSDLIRAAAARRGQRAPRGRRAHRARRHPRRQLRLRGAVARRARRAGRRCRWATPSPRSCCSRPASS